MRLTNTDEALIGHGTNNAALAMDEERLGLFAIRACCELETEHTAAMADGVITAAENRSIRQKLHILRQTINAQLEMDRKDLALAAQMNEALLARFRAGDPA